MNVKGRGKRLSTVPVKMNDEERQAFTAVATAEDRPLGYVMRTLALHGLAMYQKQKDKRLREPEGIQTVLATAIDGVSQNGDGKKVPAQPARAKSK